ncbi:SPFH/Band 7/PHB domain protein [Planctomonas sp. JC2975]|uniref:SPFH domain-containing protein n=1 Tax=Planctomonas sp. JC2975 TaxID=2729626 RepID=UPI001474B8E7|nr:SPFH domain-containing protein [Planctomonas sp. JC2975]NNC10444.1 SPFH/Band 7/PHB domain protein [Planctomonas sp. JC2975]
MTDVEVLVIQIIVAIIVAIVLIFVLVTLFRSVRIVPQATAGIVERLGRYHKTLMPGLNLLVPFIDRLRPLIDMREQVVSFPPQPVITEDNLVVSIDTVVYFQVTDARAATYEIANYLSAVEQLTTTTLRNVVGGLNLEETLTSRDNINSQLRSVLDEATGKWGIRVSRVELKAIDPPASIQDSMEKQMRAERDRRALILTAEGTKQSAILTAEGTKQAAILNAEGSARAQVLNAEGQAKAIQTVFTAIHEGQPDNLLLAYQYLQTLPKIAESPSNKMWFIPSEFTEALRGIGEGFATRGKGGPFAGFMPPSAGGGAEAPDADAPAATARTIDYADLSDDSADAAVAEAEAEAAKAEERPVPGLTGAPVVPPVASGDGSSADVAPAPPAAQPAPTSADEASGTNNGASGADGRGADGPAHRSDG